jgi:cytochrome P450
MPQAPELPLYMRRDGFSPVDELARVREGEGVVRVVTPFGGQAYLITRYDDIRAVLADPVRFSSVSEAFDMDAASQEERERRRAGSLIAFDPPEHTRLRRLFTPEFTVRRMRVLEPRIVEIVAAALDDLERAGKPADLVAHFALPVPSLVICELLGVPYADRDGFQERAARLLDVTLPLEQRRAAQQEDRAYLAGLVVRAQQDPGEDMLGMLVREHGAELSTDELAGIAWLLLLAGHETTSNMLGLGTLALLRHPEQLAMIRDDPARVEPAVEELLRWLSIVNFMPSRTATTDVEIGGHRIPAGSIVQVCLVTGNRDPAFVDDPDTLDITRGAPGHLAFGHGVHHCLGAPLARMEMRIAFPALLQRFPSLALADPYEQVEFRAVSVVYGVQSLNVTW